MTASLKDLFADMAVTPDLAVSGLAMDSRAVQGGDLFLAVSGVGGHGLDHIEQALERGAVAVAWEPQANKEYNGPVPGFPVADLGRKVGLIASRFHGHPSRDLFVVGVTGTNGKSSVVSFVAQALNTKSPAGQVGTVGWGPVGALEPATHTTPDPISLHAQLARMRDQGIRSVAMEVSSHALDQDRVSGVAFDAAIVTNVSRDHLDYHGSMEAYVEAKARLFALDGLKFAIVNADDAHMNTFKRAARPETRIIETSIEDTSTVAANSLRLNTEGMAFDLVLGTTQVSVRSGLLGRFNVYNLLSAAAVLYGLDWEAHDIAAALRNAQAPDGRLSPIRRAGFPLVLIDYAHTPDALEKALAALNDHGFSVVCCVFGCGGNRDQGKRPLMGRAVEAAGAAMIITDDNPRFENGDAIVEQIVAGLRNADRALVERDRRKAIALALHNTPETGVVLIAGKGHEDYQEIDGQKIPYDDFSAVAECMERAA